VLFKYSFNIRSWLICLFVLLGTQTFAWCSKPQNPMAAKLPQHLTGEVFGNPAVSSTVRGAVICALETRLEGLKGVTVTYQLPQISSLGPGSSETIKAIVTAQAPGSAEAYGPVWIKITNSGYQFPVENQLWFCNQPERLIEPIALYANRLGSGTSIRLLYHQVCYNTMPLFMSVQVVNDSNIDARFLLISGDADPDPNPALAGILASKEYLIARYANCGDVIDLPAHTKIPIALRRMVMGQVMSGIMSIELLKGGPPSLLVRADCRNFVGEDNRSQIALMSSKPAHFLLPVPTDDTEVNTLSSNSLAYDDPAVNTTLTVNVGDPTESTLIGVEGIERVGGGRKLNGNYGVLYHIQVALSNKISVSSRAIITFKATSAYTGGAFMFEGRPVLIRPIKLNETRVIGSVNLRPGEYRLVTLYAIPSGGCTYPAEIDITTSLSSTAISKIKMKD